MLGIAGRASLIGGSARHASSFPGAPLINSGHRLPSPPAQRRCRQRAITRAFTTPPEPYSRDDGTTAPSAPVQSDDPQQGAQAASEPPAFDWARNWYPVALVGDLETERPNSLQLLGKHIAVWREPSGAWRAVEDKCPHRQAALSDGHISSGGDIVCPYHGWQFDSEGKCTHIPQAIDVAAERTACDSSRSRVAPFPVTERQGMLWLWGQSGSQEFIHSSAKALPVAEEAEDSAWFALPANSAEHPVDYTIMLENSFDPSHSNFVHGGTFENRKDAIPMKAKLKTSIDPVGGFKVDHGPYSGAPDSMQAERQFIPPCTLRATYRSGPVTRLFMVHLTPLRPGVSRSFFQLCFKTTVKPNWKSKLLSKLPKPSWLSGFMHISGSKAADQDALVLHRQDQRLHRANLAAAAAGSTKPGWRSYYMATPSDVAVDAYRRWLTMAGGAPAFEGNQEYQPELSMQQLQDRWPRHVAHCKECQKTAQVTGQISRALRAASWVFGIIAVWLASAAAIGGTVAGHAIAMRGFYGVPVAVFAATAAAACQYLQSRTEAARKEFHVPDRVGVYPLNDPGV